jgi:hypothetical protein
MRLTLAVLLCLCAHAVPAQEVFFQSPSGNIQCAIFDGTAPVARCDIGDCTSSFARPGDCDLDWGYAFEVGASGPGYPLCAGDTVAVPGARVLGYGQSVSLGGITCTSAQTGMTCRNAGGGGFALSKARQRVF